VLAKVQTDRPHSQYYINCLLTQPALAVRACWLTVRQALSGKKKNSLRRKSYLPQETWLTQQKDKIT